MLRRQHSLNSQPAPRVPNRPPAANVYPQSPYNFKSVSNLRNPELYYQPEPPPAVMMMTTPRHYYTRTPMRFRPQPMMVVRSPLPRSILNCQFCCHPPAPTPSLPPIPPLPPTAPPAAAGKDPLPDTLGPHLDGSKQASRTNSFEIENLLKTAEQVTGICRSPGETRKSSPTGSVLSAHSQVLTPSRQLTDAEKLKKVILELIETERTYVKVSAAGGFLFCGRDGIYLYYRW